ncbi:hypothetical protein [Sphingomonas oryzagri]
MANETSGEDGPAGNAPKRAGGARTRKRTPSSAPQNREHWPLFEEFGDRERRILSFLAEGYSAKEIADFEHDTDNAVEQVIKRIRAKCSGISRRLLMRSYRDWEKSKFQTVDKASEARSAVTEPDLFSVDQNPVLVEATEAASQEPSVHRDDATAAEADPVPVRPGKPYRAQAPLRLPVGIGGSGRNDLGRAPTSLVVIMIALASVVLIGAILALLFTADRLQIGH